MTHEISKQRYEQFIMDYQYNNKYPGKRLGQAFCDEFGITDESIKHAPTDTVACELIVPYIKPR